MWKIPKTANLENFKNLQSGEVSKFAFWIILKIPIVKFRKFEIWKIPKISNLGKFLEFKKLEILEFFKLQFFRIF